ncbi:MAG: hypothetical protein J1F67_02490 [Muribaculaceae bacterium]|nr:hypothetical protein [Muribaculaceae bacterium]
MEAKTLNWNKGRGYHPFQNATYEGIYIENLSDSLKYDYLKLPNSTDVFSLNFRAKNLNGNPYKRYPYFTSQGRKINISNPHWGFFVTLVRDTIVFSIKGDEIQTATESVPALDVSVFKLKSSTKSEISLTEKINPYDGDNIWNITIENNVLILSVGDKNLNQIYEFEIKYPVTGFGFLAGWADKLLISDIKVEFTETKSDSYFNFQEMNADYFSQNDDPMEGYWSLFDRELEESLLKLGGRYTLLCKKEGDKYNMIYVDGANVNNQNWHPGDLKAILSPTPFSDIFEVEWLDSMKESMKRDIKAQKGDGETLLIQFPYQSSKIRLRKIPNP